MWEEKLAQGGESERRRIGNEKVNKKWKKRSRRSRREWKNYKG